MWFLYVKYFLLNKTILSLFQTTCGKQNTTVGSLKQIVYNKTTLRFVPNRLRETKHNCRQSQTTCL